jgi:hypothetical protein
VMVDGRARLEGSLAHGRRRDRRRNCCVDGNDNRMT